MNESLLRSELTANALKYRQQWHAGFITLETFIGRMQALRDVQLTLDYYRYRGGCAETGDN